MHNEKNPWKKLTRNLVKQAALNAIRGKSKKADVIKFNENFDSNVTRIYYNLKYHKYKGIDYTHTIKYNYKKKRIISKCNLENRVIMHTLLLLGEEKYEKVRTDFSYNCIKGRGINSKNKVYSLNHMIKQDIYEHNYWGWLQLDLRKCYQSTNGKLLYRNQLRMYGRGYFTDILRKSSVCDLGIPIGTPMSPFSHHVMMIKFDHFCKEELGIKSYRRYADDIRIGGDREQLNTWSWRIRNYLFYECSYLVKGNLKIRPSRVPCDIGGYVYHKTKKCERNQHNKGYARIRPSTRKRAIKKPSETSYFGIMKYGDACNLMKSRMDVNELLSEMIIQRSMDSDPVDLKDIENKPVEIRKYDVRKPSKPDGKWWLKMLVSYRESPDSKFKQLRVVKGCFEGICLSLNRLDKYIANKAKSSDVGEDEIRKLMFPLTNVVFVNDGGWIIKGTINKINQIEE